MRLSILCCQKAESMSHLFYENIRQELDNIKSDGLYKDERLITSKQAADVIVSANGTKQSVINLCANNYLGLADAPELIEANGGLFEPLLGPEDAIISDALNHASIIDGIRLCKAKRYRYKTNDMADLEDQLNKAKAEGARHILIATDGVFSMDGTVANLPAIISLKEKFDALLMVDDCHATGFMGEKGRGSAEHCGVLGGVDILTGTLGKALGGAMGGFTCGKQGVIDMLRQRSRPYLFSNALAPSIVGASLKAVDLAQEGNDLRTKIQANAKQFRTGMSKAGFTLVDGSHPIIPVMLGDAQIAQDMASKLMDEGIYVTGFFFPVVPKGKARIRTQMSAAHSSTHIEKAIAAFTKVGRELGVI